MDANKTYAKPLLNTSLGKAVADLVWNWVDQPWGEQYDNGFCDSEMLAHDLKKILMEAHDDHQLVHGLYHYIAERERYNSDSRGITPVRQMLEQHGHDVPPRPTPPPRQDSATKTARRGLMGLFRR